MNLKEFINENYGFKEFTWDKVKSWMDMYMIGLASNEEFENFEEIKNYELQDGDVIDVAMCFKTYKGNKKLSYNFLKENQSDIGGLGDSGLSNIKKVLGNTFTIEELEDNLNNIGYVSKKTLENIKSAVKEND